MEMLKGNKPADLVKQREKLSKDLAQFDQEIIDLQSKLEIELLEGLKSENSTHKLRETEYMRSATESLIKKIDIQINQAEADLAEKMRLEEASHWVEHEKNVKARLAALARMIAEANREAASLAGLVYSGKAVTPDSVGFYDGARGSIGVAVEGLKKAEKAMDGLTG